MLEHHQKVKIESWNKALKNDPFLKNFELVFNEESDYCREILELMANPVSPEQVSCPAQLKIPIYIGTQFGIAGLSHHAMIEFSLIGIIGRSALSGTLGGISVYKGRANRPSSELGTKIFSV